MELYQFPQQCSVPGRSAGKKGHAFSSNCSLSQANITPTTPATVARIRKLLFFPEVLYEGKREGWGRDGGGGGGGGGHASMANLCGDVEFYDVS